MRYGVTAAHRQARGADADRLQTPLDRAHHQVLGAQRHFVGALPVHHHDKTGIDCLDDDFVTQVECQPDAVKARPEIGTGRLHHGMGDQSGRQDGNR